MSKKCQLTGKQSQFGNTVSHSNRKTRRRFLPNIQCSTFLSDVLGNITLKVTPKTIKTVEFKGGIDKFLLNTKNAKLTDEAKKLRKRLQKALAKKETGTAKKAAKA